MPAAAFGGNPTGSEVEIECDDYNEWNVANLDLRKSLADQVWFPARLRVFLDQSGEHPSYRLAICRDHSLLSDYLVQPHSDKVVLNYASDKKPLAIWFQHSSGGTPLCFSPRESNQQGICDLVDFQSIFMDESEPIHYPRIDSFTIEDKHNRSREFTNPTAQIWQTKTATKASFSTSHDQPSEASRILIFSAASIFVVPVIDQISLTRKADAPSTLYLANKSRDRWLSVYEVKGDGRVLPGLNVNCSISAFQRLCPRTVSMLATIKFRFPNTPTREFFAQKLEECFHGLTEEARKLRDEQDFQRHPIIEARSTFNPKQR